jgi:hypothetical protein
MDQVSGPTAPFDNDIGNYRGDDNHRIGKLSTQVFAEAEHDLGGKTPFLPIIIRSMVGDHHP